MGHNFKKGDRVQWTDPADADRDPVDIAEVGSSSGPGTIIHVQHDEDDAVISISRDDGGGVEAFPHELNKI